MEPLEIEKPQSKDGLIKSDQTIQNVALFGVLLIPRKFALLLAIGLGVLVILIIVLAVSLRGSKSGPNIAGSGPMETVHIDVGSYKNLEVDSGITTQVSIGKTKDVAITLHTNSKEYLDAKLSGDTLHIKFKPGTDVGNHGASAAIIVTDPLDSAVANSGSHITIDKLGESITANGGSHVTAKEFGSGSNANVVATGGSHVLVTNGKPKKSLTVTLSAADGSSVKGLSVNVLTVQVSGGASVEAAVQTTVSGTCEGGGQVTIKGAADASGLNAGSGCTKILTPT